MLVYIAATSAVVATRSAVVPGSVTPDSVEFPSVPGIFVVLGTGDVLDKVALTAADPTHRLPEGVADAGVAVDPPSVELQTVIPSAQSAGLIQSVGNSVAAPSKDSF